MCKINVYRTGTIFFYHFPLAPPPPLPQDELLLPPLLLLFHDLPGSLVNDLSQPFEDADPVDKLPVAVVYHVADGSLPLKTEGTSTLFASLAGCISPENVVPLTFVVRPWTSSLTPEEWEAE